MKLSTFLCLLPIWISSFVNSLFKPFAHFSIRLSVFFVFAVVPNTPLRSPSFPLAMSSLRFLDTPPTAPANKVPQIIDPPCTSAFDSINHLWSILSRRKIIPVEEKDGGNSMGAVLLSLGHLWLLPHLSWVVSLISPSFGSEDNSMDPSWCLQCSSQAFLLWPAHSCSFMSILIWNFASILCACPRKSC